jgi:transcriptional regulator with XRE-family HTH domain
MLERGKRSPTLETMAKLAKGLGMSVAELAALVE